MSRIKEKKVLVGLMVIASWLLLVTPIVWAGPIEEAVELTQKWAKAFHEGNAEELSNLYAKDGVYISWAGPFPSEGREAIRATYAGFFRMFPIRQIIFRDESRKVYGDTVTYNNNWTLIYGDGKGPIKTVYGRSSSVNKVVEGKRLLLFQATSLLPIAVP